MVAVVHVPYISDPAQTLTLTVTPTLALTPVATRLIASGGHLSVTSLTPKNKNVQKAKTCFYCVPVVAWSLSSPDALLIGLGTG